MANTFWPNFESLRQVGWVFIVHILHKTFLKNIVQCLNPPQVVLDQVASYKTEMDSIAQFVEQECSLEPETKCAASKLYEAYRHFCQAIGRKPQSTNAFKKALDKLTGVYQSSTSSGMQWQGIKPVLQF